LDLALFLSVTLKEKEKARMPDKKITETRVMGMILK
jgi:hypothetical protein